MSDSLWDQIHQWTNVPLTTQSGEIDESTPMGQRAAALGPAQQLLALGGHDTARALVNGIGQPLHDIMFPKTHEDYERAGSALIGMMAAPEAMSGGAMNEALAGSIGGIWHGGGHFAPEPGAPFGKFNPEYLGTGEGAQVYGEGHYLAENPGVATGYVPKGEVPIGKDGQPLAQHEIAEKYYAPGNIVEGPEGSYGRVLNFNKGEPHAQGWTVKVQPVDPKQWDPNGQTSSMQVPEEWRDKADAPYEHNVMPNAYEIALRARLEGWPTATKGALYQTDILREPHEMLDFDRPLGGQSPHVLNALAKVPEFRQFLQELDRAGGDPRTLDGGDVYFGIKDAVANNYKSTPNYDLHNDSFAGQTSKLLSDAGIAGNRYLDQGSRAKGQGTSNYVIFRPEDIRITHKNGVALDSTPYDSIEDQPK